MKTTSWILGLTSVLLAAGCSSTDDADLGKAAVSSGERPSAHAQAEDDDDGDEADERVDVAALPDAVVKAAQAAVPGFVIVAAEKESENGKVVYSLEGSANGEACEVEVTADGTVTEIEHGDDEDDGDDD